MELRKKEEYVLIDYVKFILIFLVANIHLSAFEDVNDSFSFWLTQVICRIAVPFFFVSSGFFLSKYITNKVYIKKYIIRLIQLYLIYTVLYLPQMIYLSMKSGKSLALQAVDFVRNFFFVGSYGPLWFFVGLIVATLLFYFFVNVCKLSELKLLVLSTVLYAIGVLGNTYQLLFINVPVLGKIIELYNMVFDTTRNGLFLGLFFLAIGYYISKKQSQINKSCKFIINSVWYCLYVCRKVFCTEIS